MGGNKGKRTKGNAKPSSSGRTAELLSASGVTGFVGFSGLSSDLPGFVVPVGKQPENEEIDVSVDNDFKLVLRKATKRDTVTKIKALQEFSQLCQTKDDEAVKGALPFWPRLYTRLAIDHDRRVREATHQAHKSLIIKVKKNIAPYLKSLMGVWVVSMSDLYAPAASAAIQAFQIAFPLAKQAGAMEFCKEEIFNYMEDVLFSQTATTLSDPKNCDVEEMESKYLRLIAGCFHGLKQLLVIQGSATNERTQILLSKILSEPKYWKYAKHKDHEVRRAWFSVLPALCQFYPVVIIENSAKVCPLTLGQLGEDHPVVAPAVWEAVLHIIVVIQDCWSHVNLKSAFLPPLWSTLTEGGKGNAGTTFQNLLPLLSKLPEAITEPRIQFYERFYGCFRNGMKFDKNVNSVSELRAIVKAYLECIRFSLLQHLTLNENDVKCRNHLIEEQLVPLVKEALTNNELEHYSILFGDLGEFLRFLDTQALKDKTNSEGVILTETLLQFCSKIFEICQGILENENDHQEKLLSRLSLFFHSLYFVPKSKKIASNSVRFQSDSGANVDERTITPDSPDIVCGETEGVLADETLKFCRIVFYKLKQTPRLPFLKLLSETTRVVPSIKLFDDLLSAQIENIDPISKRNEMEAPLQFVRSVLVPWLENRKELFGTDQLAVECIVSMALSACFCIPDELVFTLLDEIGMVKDPLVLEILIVEASKLRKSEPKFKKWLKGDFVGKLMVELADLLSKQLFEDDKLTVDLELGRKLLYICFTATKDFDPIISSEYMNTILASFTTTLSSLVPSCLNHKTESSQRIVNLVCDLATNLFQSCQGCWLLPAVESLLVSLFKLSCCIVDKKILGSPSFLLLSTKLEETWMVGAKRLVELNGGDFDTNSFLNQASKTINEIVTERKFSYDKFNEIEVLSEKVIHLLEACVEGLKMKEETRNVQYEKMNEILEHVLPSSEIWSDSKSEFMAMCSIRNVVSTPGSILPLLEITTDSLLTNMPRYFVLVKFTASVINSLFEAENLESLGSLDQIEQDEDAEMLNRDYLKPMMVKHLPRLMMGVAFTQHIYITPQVLNDHELRSFCIKLPETVSLFLESITFGEFEDILNETGNRALSGSYSESLTLSTMVELGLKRFDKVGKWCGTFLNTYDYLGIISEVDNGALNTVHCLIPYMSSSCVIELVNLATNHLLCDRTDISERNKNWYLDVLASCFNSQRPDIYAMQSIQENLTIVLERLFNLRKANPEIYNPSWQASDSIQKLEFVTQIGSIFYAAVQHFPHLIAQDFWDMILCVVVSWIQRCYECTNHLLTEPTMYTPTIVIFQLLCLIQKTFSKLKMGAGGSDFMHSLLQEWDELYLDAIVSVLLPMFLDLGDLAAKVTQSVAVDKILSSISKLLNELPTDLVFKCVKEKAAKNPAIDNLPSELSFLLQRLHPMLMLGVRPLVFGSHAILFSIMHKIPELQVIDEQNEEQEEKSRPPPTPLVSTLQNTSQIVEAMLQNFQIGDCCLVQPYTDTFHFTFVYLLSWIQMLELFGAANSEVRSEYAVFLDKSKLLDGLLFNLFRLMPSSPVLSPESQKGYSPSTVKTMFTEPLYTDVDEEATFAELQQLACHVFLITLKQLPALVRQWWHNQDKRTAEIVNRYTSNYVSACISLQEIKAVQETDTKFPNMTVKGRPVAREVVARYSMEEVTIELVIKLPANHPLGPVSVETSQRVGVSLTQWRNWMLQLTTFLTHQNGSILDGLSLWKRNVDKRFEGIEECMICFYVLHGATCQLPKLTCRTCKKRFHSACLYKWFSTSQNSTCPLCRNLF